MAKTGSTKLMSESEIRDINVKRWINKMSHNLDIVVDGELVNLKKIVSLDLSSEFSFISLYVENRNLYGYINMLYYMIDNNDLDILSGLKENYKAQNQLKLLRILNYRNSKSIIKSGFVKKIFDDIFKLGNEINSKFININIETIDDLYRINNQFSSLNGFIKMDRNRLNGDIMNNINNFNNEEYLNYYYLKSLNDYKEEDYKKDLIKIERIRSYLRSL